MEDTEKESGLCDIFEYYSTGMNAKMMIKNPLFSLVTSLQTRYSVCSWNTISVVFIVSVHKEGQNSSG
jgi:hypothetical protein